MRETDDSRGPVTAADIEAAAAIIESDIRRTPLWRLPGAALGAEFVFAGAAYAEALAG
jgi:hypothetical protein